MIDATNCTSKFKEQGSVKNIKCKFLFQSKKKPQIYNFLNDYHQTQPLPINFVLFKSDITKVVSDVREKEDGRNSDIIESLTWSFKFQRSHV